MRATAMCWAMALAMSPPIEAEQAPPLAVTAVVSTAGPYGELWELAIDPKGTASLQIGYMLNPLGSMSGQFQLTPQVLDAIRGAVSSERFFELPPSITQDRIPLHAPDLRLTIALGDRRREVRVYDPEELQADSRVKRFLAVWNQVFAAVPLKPKW